MKKKDYCHFLSKLLWICGILLSTDVSSQAGDTIPAIHLPLPYEEFSLYDFALVRKETDRTEKPPDDITKRIFRPVKEYFNKDSLYFSDSVKSFWIKFQIANNQASDTTIALVFLQNVSKAVLFEAQGENLKLIGKGGFFIAKLKRQISYHENRIDLVLKANSKTDFFIQVILFHGIFLPRMPVLESIPYAELQAFDFDKKFQHGLWLWEHFFMGIFFMFFLFGFIKYLILGKDKAYLYYALLGLFSALMAAAMAEYPPLELPWFENLRGIELFGLLKGVATVMQWLFILEILQLKSKYPRISLAAKWFIFSGLFFVTIHTISFIVNKDGIYALWVIHTIYKYIGLLFMFGWVWYLARIRKGFYRFIFLGALTIFTAVALQLIVEYFNLYYLLPPGDQRGIDNHFLQIALLIDMLFYFAGLAYRERQVERDKIMFQEQLISQLEDNKIFQEKFTADLEEQVKERTNELNNSLIKLKSTQDQLIQSEKMASLGELTSGIAHEIKNPLNFINNFSEINMELITEIEEEQIPNMDETHQGPLTQILRGLKKNSEKINNHGKRIDGIVKGMLQHSRLGNVSKELVNINTLCEESLKLAYHGFRSKEKTFNAVFETRFSPDLPLVMVIPQDIGRVLLNLINNAFYAVTSRQAGTLVEMFSDQQYELMEDSLAPGSYTPRVIVSTYQKDNKIFITISDNGTGIPASIIGKIFQPFFTTKPTGEGTGLGLSMAYDIITKGHGGTITVNSFDGLPGGDLRVKSGRGIGTDFEIILPISFSQSQPQPQPQSQP